MDQPINHSVQVRFLVKHVTGRVLYDSGLTKADKLSESQPSVRLTGSEGKWLIEAAPVTEGQVEQMNRHRGELNLFYFEERQDADPPIRKWWLYGKAVDPLLQYSQLNAQLSVEVDTKVEYSNDRVIL